ncbi:protein kinase domain-containing protein [Rhodococcus gannanensis]|uniref:Serine/threonine-protein kinase PknK n=1 Tax=Rhodococcus gannanensis TaxID=1960308 RepID=A0ABW4P8N1_9NOCA
MTADPPDPSGRPGRDVTADLQAAGFTDGEEIGRGGFGVVYRCRQPQLDRTVAVKVLSGDLDEDSRERFLREQRAMGAVSGHPHICNILQVGTTASGRPYIVMPYHPHNSLQELLHSAGPLHWPDVLTLGAKMAGALETAHRSGTLHRDVKPANILLTEYGEPQLTDFGIARTTGGFETGTGHITGSPAYTAPEVLDGRSPSVRSDVYGLGATLFCAMTGHAAFERRDGEQLVAQFVRVTSEPVPDLRGGDIPADVCAVIEKAMAPDPRDRPASAAELGALLQDLASTHGLDPLDMALPAPDSPPPGVAGASTPYGGRTGASTPNGGRTGRTPGVTGPTPPTPATRFRAPVIGRTLVTRERLVDQLRAGERKRLTVIHAPAGFGKTTLAAQWGGALVEDDVTVAWLSIAADDDNPAWFLGHLVEAVRRAAPALSSELDQALEDHGADAAEYVMSTLINRIHEDRRRVAVVIDDWHRVTSRESRAALAYLLDNGCHHLQVVVTTRTTAGLPLARMRVQDELIEIDSTALRFEEDESQRLLVELGGLELSDTDVARLCRSTEGWAAALQLASLSLRGRDHPAELIDNLVGQQAVDEFLAENVLDTLEPELLDFLLATSITERITGSLASALAGVPDGRSRLEEVAARDLFLLRLGDHESTPQSTGPIETWYRYHHLFAKYLRRRLRRDHPERFPALHRTASDWFAERHLLSEAVDHALAAGDPDAAVELVERDGVHLIEHSRMTTLLGLVDKLPPTTVVGRPRLQLTVAWSNVLLQRPGACRRALSLARGALETDPDGPLAVEADVVEGVVAAFTDRPEGIEHYTERCLAAPERHNPWVVTAAANTRTFAALYRFDFDETRYWQKWAAPYYQAMSGSFATMYGYCMVGVAANEELSTEAAEDWFRRGLRVARELSGSHSHSARLAAAMLGELLYERNELAEAERLLDEGFEIGGEGGIVEFMIARYVTGARLKVRRGDREAAAQRLDEGARTAEDLDIPRLRARIDNERIRLGFPVASRTRTPRHPTLPPVDSVPDGSAEITAQLEDATTARLLMRTGTGADTALACEIAEAWVARLAGTGRARARLMANRLLTACLFAAGRDDDALRVLATMTATCARHGLVRYVLDGGPALVAGLATLQARARAGTWEPGWEPVPAGFLDDCLSAAKADGAM